MVFDLQKSKDEFLKVRGKVDALFQKISAGLKGEDAKKQKEDLITELIGLWERAKRAKGEAFNGVLKFSTLQAQFRREIMNILDLLEKLERGIKR